MNDPVRTSSRSGRGRRRWIAVTGLAAAAGLVAVYVSGGFADNTARACAAANERAAAIDPLIEGPIAALQPLEQPVSLAALSFDDAAGNTVNLGDFAGKTVLFNLWATWCAPCRAEMPSLAALRSDLGGDKFEVVAVSIDSRADSADLRGFLEETDASALELYHDPTMALFNGLKDKGLLVGMPTSFLVDPAGCAFAVLQGPAAWDSPRAKAVIRAAMGAGPAVGNS